MLDSVYLVWWMDLDDAYSSIVCATYASIESAKEHLIFSGYTEPIKLDFPHEHRLAYKHPSVKDNCGSSFCMFIQEERVRQ